jgi:hypothetical protein
MSKSKPKGFTRNNWYDDYAEHDYIDRQELTERRKSKKMKNLIRSKNISGLLEIDNDDMDPYEWKRR